MTPQQHIKHMILAVTACWDKKELPAGLTGEQIDQLYEQLVEEDGHWDGKSEVRASGVETGLPCEYSRHYESKAVAAKSPSGVWVGWTYWYGGGKHGEPDAIDWIEDAYFVDCKEEQKVMTVRTFTIQEQK